MTVEEAKRLLESNGIPFEVRRFRDYEELFQSPDMATGSERPDAAGITAVSIRCKNGHKDIVLAFEGNENQTKFVDLFFGAFAFELFDWQEAELQEELLSIIRKKLQGTVGVIEVYDLKRKRFVMDACHDLSDDEEREDREKMIARIHKPRTILEKLFHSRKRYEVYDLDSYCCIIR